MKKVFFDVNVILDWALDREPFFKSAKMLIEVVERREILAYVSPLAMSNAFYFVKKDYDKAHAKEFLLVCQKLFQFIDNPATALTQAIDNPYKDFEDDLHFYSAMDNNMEILVTRNPKDFPLDKTIQVLTPDELLYELGY